MYYGQRILESFLPENEAFYLQKPKQGVHCSGALMYKPAVWALPAGK
jgi:hypothetical protein